MLFGGEAESYKSPNIASFKLVAIFRVAQVFKSELNYIGQSQRHHSFSHVTSFGTILFLHLPLYFLDSKTLWNRGRSIDRVILEL